MLITDTSRLSLLSLELPYTFLFLRFPSKALRDTFIPCYHVPVRLRRETLARQYLWEDVSSGRIFDIPAPNGFSKKFGMLCWAKEELDGLPHYPALRL